MSDNGKGAYGFRVVFCGDEAPTQDLVELDETVPEVRYTWYHASPLADVEEVTDDAVRLATRGSAAMYVHRDPPSITYVSSERLPTEAHVHPVLAVPMSMLARWRGDMTVHAGAFENDGGAWAVVGKREAGKSTTLAALGRRGLPVVADDFLTVEDGEVWAGPHCVDLRPDVAPRFPDARLIGEFGGRKRYRLSTPPSRARLPLRGFFLLDWWEGPDVEVAPMPAREILGLMVEQEYIALMGLPAPEKLLDFAARPAWRVRRPRSWQAGEAALDAILAATDQA